MSRDFTIADPTATAPFELFESWMEDAKANETNDANAMSVATADAHGAPNVRILLLKGLDEKGFVFYTNFESPKGQELQINPQAALCFHWKSLLRQVRICGPVEQVSDAEADAYYNSRPEGSRIGAWASQQSRPLESRAVLERAVAEYTRKYADAEIPRPSHWSGFRVTPLSIEFWQNGSFRLHDRIVFSRENPQSKTWRKTRLYP
nr:pyridoxamine 5'-phosphate oxidase [Pararhizobium sp. IMCC3301]